MYRPKHYSEDRIEVLHSFIKNFPLATVVTSGSDGIQANLIPTILHCEGEKGLLRFHIAKANPQSKRLAAGDQTLLIFQGPEGYVTPNFYPTKNVHGKVVPTWNYSMVQARGKLKLFNDTAWILQHLGELTDLQEKPYDQPWKVSDAPSEFINGLVETIVGVEIEIEVLEGKFKVSQNQPSENRAGVAEGFIADGNEAMAELVKNRGFSNE